MHFLREQRPVSRLQILLIQMKTCIASSCLWAVAILKSLLCLSAGALQESRGCSIYQHTAFRVFFNRLTTCTYWTAQWLGHCWRGLTQTELADWQYESGNTNTDLKLTQTAATQYTCSTLPTNSTLLPASTMAEQLHPQQPSHDDTICRRYATYEISRNCPIRTALTFQCRHWRLYLSQTQKYQQMHISLNMPKDGSKRYALFFKITSEINTWWLFV